MVESKNLDETTHKRISFRNVKDIETLGKAGYSDAFNDIVSRVVAELKELRKENKKLKDEIKKLKKEKE